LAGKLLIDDTNVATVLEDLSHSPTASQYFVENLSSRPELADSVGLVGYIFWGPQGSAAFGDVIRAAARGTGAAYAQAAQAIYAQTAVAFDHHLCIVQACPLALNGIGQAITDTLTFSSNINALTDLGFYTCASSQESPTVLAKVIAVVVRTNNAEFSNAWNGSQSGLISLLPRLEKPIGVPPVPGTESPPPPPLTEQALSNFGNQVGVFRGLYMGGLHELAIATAQVTDSLLQGAMLVYGFASDAPLGIPLSILSTVVAGGLQSETLSKLVGYQGTSVAYEASNNYVATSVPIMARALVVYLMAEHPGMFWTPLPDKQIQNVADNPLSPPAYTASPNSANTSDIRNGTLSDGNSFDNAINAGVSNFRKVATQTYLNVGTC
jgi:hypothetical protein